MTSGLEWFKDWFDSPYYHILYQHRDEEEAKRFINNLLAHLRLILGAKVLDLACGKGRHAVYLSKKGFEVTGIDLSGESILYASQFESSNLAFYVHDMRMPFRNNYFDLIINLFTSFGYFEDEADDIRVLQSVKKSLKRGGIFVLDYLNADKVTDKLKEEETIHEGPVTFHIRRSLRHNFIIKEIKVIDNKKEHLFQEQVRMINLADFHRLFKTAGLTIQSIYGNYDLDAYDPSTSDRLILLGMKNN